MSKPPYLQFRTAKLLRLYKLIKNDKDPNRIWLASDLGKKSIGTVCSAPKIHAYMEILAKLGLIEIIEHCRGLNFNYSRGYRLITTNYVKGGNERNGV